MFCLMYSFIACQYIQTQHDLENGYVPEVLAQVKFGLVRTQYTYGQLYIHIQASPVKIQTPYTGTRSAKAWPLLQLCYHPAVFLHHLYVIVLSFPQGIIWRTFLKCC
jgi:hypothetical protein